MRSSDAIAMLAHQVRTLLIQAPTSALPMNYQQVANALGLTPPRTIARVTQALEQLMEQDVAAGRPMIAALVISRRGDGLPGSGFFEKAVALGRFPSDPNQQCACYIEERDQALRARD
ncbi:MAG: hypothetical protein KYX60_09785 [Halomonas meridiana]|uniref:hypothetical protein n=1 Tax=Vreelandella aquamarina TaxID=77097 RepID=UPI0024E26ABD|nr:hypothetical protein [Halomonas meridiana]MDK2750939.1 hypothetical protein [Halomonas meridiana]|tara:strand:- start:132 stop:485 length:354 start_codon:yes stop_codon:yes gene_type:complete